MHPVGNDFFEQPLDEYGGQASPLSSAWRLSVLGHKANAGIGQGFRDEGLKLEGQQDLESLETQLY